MSVYPTILIVDDEKNTREGLQKFLTALDYDVLTAENADEGWKIYKEEKPELILSDIRMPGKTGTEFLDQVMGDNPHALFILMTAYGSVEDAVKAMKKGAFYYLTKPVNLEELEFLVKKALASRSLVEENRELKQELFQHKFEKGDLVVQSAKMKEILKTVDQVAKSSAAVLIEGESGTGKELVAHRIHDLSPRKNGPFVAVHCAALTESLLSSELFGHEKGSFTGASEKKTGRFERAHQGTLFLDEIGEISAETQVKLLRVLQEGEFERVGGTKTIKVDVRIVCATNKNLIDEVKAGRFREDLYYRINVIYMKLPPLRERREDIPYLVDSFIKSFALANHKKITGIEPEALDALKKYDWPGNIRELKNILERMVVLTTSEIIPASLVPDDIRRGESGLRPSGAALSTPVSNLTEMEKHAIRQALQDVKGNKSLAAKKLGISRRTLYRKIEEYQLEQ